MSTDLDTTNTDWSPVGDWSRWDAWRVGVIEHYGDTGITWPADNPDPLHPMSVAYDEGRAWGRRYATNHHEGEPMALITHDTANRETNAERAYCEAVSLTGSSGDDTTYPPTTHRYVVAFTTSEDVGHCGDWAVVCDWSEHDDQPAAWAFVSAMSGCWLPRPVAVFDLDAGTRYDVHETHTYLTGNVPNLMDPA